MTKKILALCLIFILVFSSFACGTKNENANAEKPNNTSSDHHIDPDDPYPLYHNCDVSINGKPLPNPYYAYYVLEHNYFVVPLVAILEELGATVQWETTVVAEIALNGKQYILDGEARTFTPENRPKDNMMFKPLGNYGWFELVDDDYLITDETLKDLLIQLLDVDRNDVRLIYDFDNERPKIDIKIKPVLHILG